MSMTPEHASFLASVVAKQLQTEWKFTYKVLSAIPEAKKDFKPEPNARSAWDLAHHIAIADVGFLHAVAANSFSVFPAKTPATAIPELAEWYKVEFVKALEKVQTLDGPHLSQVVDTPWGIKLPSVLFALFCNNHMVHHRGQLTTYLRPMGSKVPAIYGGSFDEKFPS
jgi:uncharacterized damage-inducible protein DinB